jgi:WD40 repeat protein
MKRITTAVILGVSFLTLPLAAQSPAFSEPAPMSLLNAVFSPDGKQIAAAYYGYILFWDAESGRILNSIPRGAGGRDLVYSNDGRYLACAGSSVMLLSAKTGQVKRTLPEFMAGGLAFSPGGSYLAVSSGEYVHRYNYNNPDWIGGGDAAEFEPYPDAQDPNARSAGGMTTLIAWSPPSVGSLFYSPGGERLLVHTSYDPLVVLNGGTGAPIAALTAKTGFDSFGSIEPAAYNPRTGQFAFADHDSIVLLNADTAEELCRFPGSGSPLAFSPDGSRLISSSTAGAGEDRYLRNITTLTIWNTTTRRIIQTITLDGIRSAAYSPDGAKILVCAADNALHIFDARTYRETARFAVPSPAALPPPPPDLSLKVGDIRAEDDGQGGYHLYIRKKPGAASVLLTEPNRDYAYRALSRNPVNGNEIRYINNRPLTDPEVPYSIIDSTPEADAEFGSAFHLYVPRLITSGPLRRRRPAVTLSPDTVLTIRSFNTKYADYSGAMYYDTTLSVSSLLEMKKAFEEYDRLIKKVEDMDADEFFNFLLR